MTNHKVTLLSIVVLAIFRYAFPPDVKAQSQATPSQKTAASDVKHSPLACNVAALSPEQRKRIRALLNELRASRLDIKELQAGYAIRLPDGLAAIHDAAEYIALERLCCSFFDFALESESEGGPVWLTLTGRDGVKEFSRLEFGIGQPVRSSSARSAGKESPLVCNDQALSRDQRDRLAGLIKGFRSARQETRELADGYAIRLPVSGQMIQDVAEYMALVRLCGPFLQTTLQVQCEGGPIWLKLAGREGVKDLAKTELGI